jgi:hypothetical protein
MTTQAMAVMHSSTESDWRTPHACFDALDREWHFKWDLAADETSSLVRLDDQPYFYGPGSIYAEDALTVDWPRGVACFLNPPFSRTRAAAYRTGRIKQGTAWVAHPIDPDKARTYEIERWAEKCWQESQQGTTIVALIPFAPQTEWYRQYVYGHQYPTNIMGETLRDQSWSGHAALQERRLPHRISYLRPDGSPAANAGVNTAVIVWQPNFGIVGPWQPWSCYWSYR